MPFALKKIIAFVVVFTALLSPIAALNLTFAQAQDEPSTNAALANTNTVPEINITVKDSETTLFVPLTNVKKPRGAVYTARIEGNAASYARLTSALFALNYDFLLVVNAKKFIEKGSLSDATGTLVITTFSPSSLDKKIIRVPLRLKSSGRVGVPVKTKKTSGWVISKSYSHHGIDYFNNIGTPVMAAYGGTVDWISYVDLYDKGKEGNAEACGKGIGIKHGGMLAGYRTIYCHLNDVKVKIGEKVSMCQEIGSIGRTGNAWNRPAHLHFELKEIVLNPPDGERINPAPIFEKGSVDCTTVAKKKQ
ncbi:MAG: M23 family metallopeptidase [Candidatus Micrarchaeota archaeon]